MENILMLIDRIENNLIEYNLNQFKENVKILIDEIINYLSKTNKIEIDEINKIFYYMNNALTNKDYMLYLDILQNELKPFIEEITEE